MVDTPLSKSDVPQQAATIDDVSIRYSQGKQLQRYNLWYVFVSLGLTAVQASALAVLLPGQVQDLTFGLFFTGGDAGVDLTALTDLKNAVDDGTATATTDQLRQLDVLEQFEESRATSLALVTSIATVCATIAQPLVGVASDRTRSAWGRRAPWILLGGLLGAALIVAVRFAPTIAVLAVLWSLTLVMVSMVMCPFNATLADRVPDDRRATTSSMGGLGNVLGGVVGAAGAGALFSVIGLDFYFFLALLLAFVTVMFVLLNKDKSSKEEVVPPFSWLEFWKGFLEPLAHRDFRWVWIARVLLLFGYGASNTLTVYMLQSYIRPALDLEQAVATAPVLSLVSLPITILTVVIAGRVSDRLGRRKPLVIVASVMMAASLLIPLISPTLPAMFAQAAIAGIAFGIYLPVDQALFVDVLPNAEASAGRDLGIAATAANIGQTLAPLLAAQVVVITGGYGSVWVAGTVLAAFGAIAILPVRAR